MMTNIVGGGEFVLNGERYEVIIKKVAPAAQKLPIVVQVPTGGKQ